MDCSAVVQLQPANAILQNKLLNYKRNDIVRWLFTFNIYAAPEIKSQFSHNIIPGRVHALHADFIIVNGTFAALLLF